MSLTNLLPPGLSIVDAIKLFYQAVGDTFAVNLAAAAASTWIAYDICLTFADEVELVWKAKWSIPKVLYFGVRYYGLAASLMYLLVSTLHSACRHWPWYEAFGATTAIAVLFGESMFVLRLWASYKGNKQVLSLLAFCWIAELSSSVTVGIIEARTVTIMPRPLNFPLPGCYTLANVPLRNSLGAWIVNCSVATTYFVLMLYKFFTSESFKLELLNANGSSLTRWFELRSFSPLLFLLVRDGVMYFAMIFVVNALNMALSIRMEGRALEGMGIAWTIAVSSVASSRLLLNLRGFIGSDNLSLKTDRTTMQFEHFVFGSSTEDSTPEEGFEMDVARNFTESSTPQAEV
ncbi:hypothetical protein C8Q80DRAFT_506481 [Daedaleopsis nitida]|nr:hypothetical protein C8Q80DRAFT_506481 [Daedaleopsis nitida]